MSNISWILWLSSKKWITSRFSSCFRRSSCLNGILSRARSSVRKLQRHSRWFQDGTCSCGTSNCKLSLHLSLDRWGKAQISRQKMSCRSNGSVWIKTSCQAQECHQKNAVYDMAVSGLGFIGATSNNPWHCCSVLGRWPAAAIFVI